MKIYYTILNIVLVLAVVNLLHFTEAFSAGAGTYDGRRSIKKVK